MVYYQEIVRCESNMISGYGDKDKLLISAKLLTNKETKVETDRQKFVESL